MDIIKISVHRLVVNKNKLLLLVIFIIAFTLRFWNLGSVPTSINWDEAAWGYNAYTIAKEGKDEFGVFLPYKYIESFGDFKPPVYAYLTAISVKVFDLNEFSVRLPSALFGFLTVVLTYFLVREIFPKSLNKEKIAFSSALFLAISPWHIMLSRAAFEANVSSFFIVLGIFAFLRAVNKAPWFLVLSATSFVITFYTFNTARVFVPMIVVFLAFMFRKKLIDNKRQTITAFIIGVLILLPLIPFLVSPQAKLRYQEVNIFSDSQIINMSNKLIENDENSIWSKVINNRRVLYGREFVKHYFDNFDPNFLFIKGDGNPKFSTQDVGQMYIWDILFLAIGILILFRRKEGYYWLIPIWFILAIIPAATARETPHALRIETVLPTFQIFVAIGFVFFLEKLNTTSLNKKNVRGMAYFLLFLLLVNAYFFLHSYFAHYGRESAADWNHGYKDAYLYLQSVEGEYDQINFTKALGRPYIYYLFYNKTDPEFYRQNSEIERDVFGFVNVKRIGKYNFTDNKTETGKTLFVERWDKIPENIEIVKQFLLPDGSPMLVAYVK